MKWTKSKAKNNFSHATCHLPKANKEISKDMFIILLHERSVSPSGDSSTVVLARWRIEFIISFRGKLMIGWLWLVAHFRPFPLSLPFSNDFPQLSAFTLTNPCKLCGSAPFLSWHSVLTASLQDYYDRRREGPRSFRCSLLPQWEATAAVGVGPVWCHVSLPISHKDFGGACRVTKQSQWGVARLRRLGVSFIRAFIHITG